MRYVTWLWPALLLLSAAAVWTVDALLPPGLLLRTLIVLWFLTVCPGMALVRFLHLRELAAEWTLAIALSLVLDALIATILLYAGWWSPTATLSILTNICAAGALAQLFSLAYAMRNELSSS